MNDNETLVVRQPIIASTTENLSRDLRQANNIINAKYQQIDWEDRTFLNRVLTDALSSFETRRERYADN